MPANFREARRKDKTGNLRRHNVVLTSSKVQTREDHQANLEGQPLVDVHAQELRRKE